jgi:hypothetical protein
MVGGGPITARRLFGSHWMTLRSGGLIWQPQACQEAPVIELTETSTRIRVHILNAEHVRDWTGIDPPQLPAAPKLYKVVDLPHSPTAEAEEREIQNGKDNNPFATIEIGNWEGIVNKNGLEQFGSSTNEVGRENSPADSPNSRKKKHWWGRMFQ